jgi:hypothetical protein
VYIRIKFIDGTEQKEWCDEWRLTKEGLLSVYKGRGTPAIYFNMQVIKSFQEEDRI